MNAVKKTNKLRFLSLLLMLCTVVSLLPIKLFAAPNTLTPIIAVTVTNVPTPMAGESCSTDGITITTTPANAADKTSYWYDLTASNKMSSTDTFVEGHKYNLSVEFEPKADYAFEFNASNDYTGTATFNSEAADKVERLASSTNGLLIANKIVTATAGGTTITYDVWVDGTQVTSDNKDDILNDMTAFYDPVSQTLTLNGYNGGAIRANHALTVILADGSENTVTNPANNEEYCISTNNNDLTINGSGALKVIQNRYNCSAITTSAITTDTGGNLSIDMAGDLKVTTYNWHGLYAYGSVTISGNGDVSIRVEGKGTGIVPGTGKVSGTGIVSETEDVILSGSGKLTVDAKNAACAVRLKTSGKVLLLNGTGAPLSFSSGTYKAIVNQEDNTSPVGGTNRAFYNKVTGAPNTKSVVYEHALVPITTADASDIDMPVAGNTPDYNVTLPADANYRLATKKEIATFASEAIANASKNGVIWFETTSGNFGEPISPETTLIAGKEYRVRVVIVPKEGYIFAGTATGTINGKPELYSKNDSENTGAIFALTSAPFKATAGGQTTTPTGNKDVNIAVTVPGTGDNSNILLWITLLLTSCSGIVTTFVVDRKRVYTK